MSLRIYLIAFLLVGGYVVNAQQPLNIFPDSLLVKHIQVIEDLTEDYLYNSDRYVVGKFYYHRGTRDNHPFFMDNSWKSGYVEHEGEKYFIPMMRYDVQMDAVVVLKMNDNLGLEVQLDPTVTPQFSIGDHQFIYMEDVMKAGYYEQLYNSHTKVWIKWLIWVKIDQNSNSKIPRYETELNFIILKDNHYHTVKNLKQLYDVFGDRKKDLSQFKKEQNLSFTNDKSGTVKKLTEEYDNLNN